MREQAIKLAIEKGGYLPRQGCSDLKSIITDVSGREFIWQNLNNRDVVTPSAEVFMDPLFWQALGKTLGWFYKDGQPVAKYLNNDPKRTPMPMHIYYAHRWLDARFDNKEDEFWKSLIPNENA